MGENVRLAELDDVANAGFEAGDAGHVEISGFVAIGKTVWLLVFVAAETSLSAWQVPSSRPLQPDDVARVLADLSAAISSSRSADFRALASASLASALSSLQTYLAGSGTTVDPGFLSAQVRYLRGRSDEAHASASRLQSEVAAATSTVSGLARAR